MLKLCIVPSEDKLPSRGGVKEHMLQLYKQASNDSEISIEDNPNLADVVHVESAWELGNSINRPMAYVCHGGFVPSPLPSVIRNLERANVIVTVAKWVAAKFFPRYDHKTIYIPNGIDLSEFDNLPPSELEPGYILYGKEWSYYTEDLLYLAKHLPFLRFVSTYWNPADYKPDNLTPIGLVSRERMKAVIKDAAVVLITGSEVCPTLLLEAWAAGTPVLAKDIDGSKELMEVVGGKVVGGALYSTPQDAVDKLGPILKNGSEMGRIGRGYIEAIYNWPSLWQQYKALYHAMLCAEE